MDELDSLKLRYRCPECKNLESHHVSDKKRKWRYYYWWHM